MFSVYEYLRLGGCEGRVYTGIWDGYRDPPAALKGLGFGV